jgi:hypothetical protein
MKFCTKEQGETFGEYFLLMSSYLDIGRHSGRQGRAGVFNRRSGHCLKVLAGVGPELFEAGFA